MVFAEGIKDESFYDLGFGSLLIGICAQKIEVELGENGGRLHIDYTVEIEQSMSSRNSYEITHHTLGGGNPMRRADREIGDVTQKMEVLRRCKVVHLAMVDGQGLYSLPLSFGFQVEGEELTLYLHSAKEGRKVDILRAGCQVGFSMVSAAALAEGKTPCSYSCHYESLVGSGWAEEVTDAEEKCRALGGHPAPPGRGGRGLHRGHGRERGGVPHPGDGALRQGQAITC